MDFLCQLENNLKKDSRFVAEDGQLLKAKVYEAAMAMDAGLIHILMADTSVKEQFFSAIDDVLVFDKVKFAWVMQSKEFLPDSYTAYKNKIGLSDGRGELIAKKDEVVLVWPYKDCILEGGQSREEQKRQEIFYNETLAPEEVRHLLNPKVLSNAKRYTTDGISDVTSIVDDDNLIVRGNNLIALASIQKRYEGRVKCIYIDPPYNTGSDSFNYTDAFNHSAYLTFMRNRLTLAKSMLSPEGMIFISADDNESAHIKILCDEIFGAENFLTTIAYERSGVSGLGQGGSFLVNTHESIICFAKDKSRFTTNELTGEYPFGPEEMKRYNKVLLSPGLAKATSTFDAPSTGEPVIIRRHENFEIGTISMKKFKEREDEIRAEYVKNFEHVFRTTSVQAENEFQGRILSECGDGLYSAEYTVSRGKQKGQRIRAYYYNQQVFAWLRDSARVSDNDIVKTNKLSDFWTHGSIPKADLANEGGVSLRRGKKPENLLRRIIAMATNEGDLVLDFFMGSGTTAAVAHKMGRKYIGIEQLNYGKNDAVTRLRNVISGEQSGISKSLGWSGGGSFVYCELKELNEMFATKVRDAATSAEVKELLEMATKKGRIKPAVEPDDYLTRLDEFDQLTLAQQKQLVMELLDKNKLYVNYSDIDDEDMSVSPHEKAFTRSLYKAGA